MSEPTPAYVTRKEAAALCGCHLDSIRQAEKKDRLPNARTRDDGTVEIFVADLVAAGMLDPRVAAADITELAGRSRAERELVAAREELAVTTARLDALTERLDHSQDAITFLRTLLKKAAA